jgi:membrane associated rhomboid family serine protease
MAEKWFEDKFEKNRLRKYTQKRLKPNYFSKISRKLSITNWLILTNILAFIIFIILISIYNEEKIISLLAIQSNAFFSGTMWTLFTSMFMHGGAAHLLFNMISLFFIGNFVERIIGRKKYLTFYLISGIFAGLFYVTLSYFFGTTDIGARIFTSPDTFAVGASGAIFALLGLLAILTPKNKVYLIIGPLIAIIIQVMLVQIIPDSPLISLLDLLITIYFIVSIFAIFSFSPGLRKIAVPLEMPFWILPIIAIVPLMIIGLFVPLPIGNTAHLGGLIAGLIYGIYLKNKYPNKTKQLSKIFSK